MKVHFHLRCKRQWQKHMQNGFLLPIMKSSMPLIFLLLKWMSIKKITLLVKFGFQFRKSKKQILYLMCYTLKIYTERTNYAEQRWEVCEIGRASCWERERVGEVDGGVGGKGLQRCG